MVKLTSGGQWLKAEQVKNDDLITFMDAGDWIENTKFPYPDGKPKKDFIIGVECNGEAKLMRLNKTNRDILSAAWGDDTDRWLNKQAKVTLDNVRVSGKQFKTIILAATGSRKKKDEVKAWDE